MKTMEQEARAGAGGGGCCNSRGKKAHERTSGSDGYVFYLDFGGNLHKSMCW